MSLELHYHPFASFCQKALVALYENGTPFEPHLVDLGDPSANARFKSLWPIGKMPVLRDLARNRVVPEATIVIEYLATYYPGPTPLIAADVELAWQIRLSDRFYDLYVNEPMGKVVTDRLRPDGKHDTHGVELAKAALRTAYGMIEREIAGHRWAVGDAFSMADCAAAPALYYADRVVPLGDAYPGVRSYFGRLLERPSFARVLDEARPYAALFPA
jgi:glutathione S-transferase